MIISLARIKPEGTRQEHYQNKPTNAEGEFHINPGIIGISPI